MQVHIVQWESLWMRTRRELHYHVHIMCAEIPAYVCHTTLWGCGMQARHAYTYMHANYASFCMWSAYSIYSLAPGSLLPPRKEGWDRGWCYVSTRAMFCAYTHNHDAHVHNYTWAWLSTESTEILCVHLGLHVQKWSVNAARKDSQDVLYMHTRSLSSIFCISSHVDTYTHMYNYECHDLAPSM